MRPATETERLRRNQTAGFASDSTSSGGKLIVLTAPLTETIDHAGYFKDANRDVLNDPRVVVYINDGRQHLQMQPAASYDVIALEPPPIAQAGVGALYSREFYTLVRSRLRPKGYISQWLPAYQVPAATTLAMIRALHCELGIPLEILVGDAAPKTPRKRRAA